MPSQRESSAARPQGDRVVEPREDWASLGQRIRQAAMTAAAIHLCRAAGGRIDDDAASDRPRVVSGA